MANKHENLASLFTGIADSIRGKTGSTDTIVADNFPSVIAAIDTQEDLDPELADQDAKIAELQELLQGKAVPAPEDLTEELAAQSEIIAEQNELITQLAGAIEGKVGVTYPTLSNPATASEILSGYQAINGSGEVLNGTHVINEVKSGIFKSTTYGPTITIDGFSALPSHFYLFPIKSNVGLWNNAFISACYENGILTVTYAQNSSGSFYASGSTTGSITYSNGSLTVNLVKEFAGNSNDLQFKYITW